MPQFKASLLILVVEDDERTRDLLCRGLRDFGHTAMPASDGGAGFDLAMAFAFDVIVLDVGLPIRDGYEIARSIREQGRLAPILMLTARDGEDDIIRGLESGADDYLLKPFSFPELVARLRVLSRATLQSTASSALILDPSRLTATRGKTSISLTRLKMNCQRPGSIHIADCAKRQKAALFRQGRRSLESVSRLDTFPKSSSEPTRTMEAVPKTTACAREDPSGRWSSLSKAKRRETALWSSVADRTVGKIFQSTSCQEFVILDEWLGLHSAVELWIVKHRPSSRE